ncbi:hypothetical protein F2P81_009325 [Scophthalmus maximus]|uniref:Derlin n=1 Tax=Scophthalmus maximus TaxID=52904 RepID=A0A6A4T6U5_SCOMX|nr:hypothetical protein F2P81_009325 [Scophthalmus maximus]
MAYQTLQQEYLQIPVVTRAYTTACVLTTAAVVRSPPPTPPAASAPAAARQRAAAGADVTSLVYVNVWINIFIITVYVNPVFVRSLSFLTATRDHHTISALLQSGFDSKELPSIAVGHVYFFLEDVFPNQPGGGRWLKTPSIIKMLFDTPEEDANYNPLPEERPGGFAWGEGQRLGG